MNRSGRQSGAGMLALGVATMFLAATLAGCVVYEPVPAYAAVSPFDRSWSAAIGALQDQGVAINEQDRANGVIRGTRGPIVVSTFVRTQADGRVRVEFNTTGGGNTDPNLVDRITASYNARMGR